MTTQYTIDVICTPGQPLATWNLKGKPHNDLLRVDMGDTLLFQIRDPSGALLNDMTECMLMSGPMKGQSKRTPFTVDTPHSLTNAAGKVTIGHLKGHWGFSIAIVNTQKDSTSAFYFLPDPELQVGSNGQHQNPV